MIDFLLSAFGCMVIVAFWIGFWFWFLTRKDSSLTRKRHLPPPSGEDFSSDAM